jgi:hypothetical protein
VFDAQKYTFQKLFVVSSVSHVNYLKSSIGRLVTSLPMLPSIVIKGIIVAEIYQWNNNQTMHCVSRWRKWITELCQTAHISKLLSTTRRCIRFLDTSVPEFRNRRKAVISPRLPLKTKLFIQTTSFYNSPFERNAQYRKVSFTQHTLPECKSLENNKKQFKGLDKSELCFKSTGRTVSSIKYKPINQFNVLLDLNWLE